MIQTSSDMQSIIDQRKQLINLQQKMNKTLLAAKANITNSIIFCGSACSNFTVNVTDAQFTVNFAQVLTRYWCLVTLI